MLHLKGDSPDDVLSRAMCEADMLIEHGVDGLIVEDYFGTEDDVLRVLQWLSKERPNYCYGVNILHQFSKTYQVAVDYGAKFMQVDSIVGHLTPEDDIAYEKETKQYHERNQLCVLGGVRFKYMPVLSNRSLEQDLSLAKERCDAIVVTGSGTGISTEIEKISEFRAILGDFPLVVGAGLTVDNVEAQLRIADAGIVGSCLKNNGLAEEEVSVERVIKFMAKVAELRKGLA